MERSGMPHSAALHTGYNKSTPLASFAGQHIKNTKLAEFCRWRKTQSVATNLQPEYKTRRVLQEENPLKRSHQLPPTKRINQKAEQNCQPRPSPLPQKISTPLKPMALVSKTGWHRKNSFHAQPASMKKFFL
jgi:hypothetical protein